MNNTQLHSAKHANVGTAPVLFLEFSLPRLGSVILLDLELRPHVVIDSHPRIGHSPENVLADSLWRCV